MKKLMILGLTIFLTVILAACSSGEEKNPSEKKAEGMSHELIYYEVLNNGDEEDYPRAEIAYKDYEGKVKTESTSTQYLYEHILKDKDEKPKVVIDGDEYHVYRQPYMTYNQEDIEGEVESKEEVKK